MNLSSREKLIARLRRGKKARAEFVDSHLGKGIAHQIRATRDRLEWSQERLAAEVGMNQNAISRLESPEYGRPTITTLKRLASAMDVGLVVHFVPFSQMVDWVSGTPRVDRGLTMNALAIPCFAAEEKAGVLDSAPVRVFLIHSPRFAVQGGGPTAQKIQMVPAITAGTIGAIGQCSTPILMGKKRPQVETSTSFRYVQTGARQ